MWFQKKKSSPLKSQPTSVSSKAPTPTPARSDAISTAHVHSVQQLEQRLRKLEAELADLTAKHPRIHIDNVHIHQPVLENLTFRLDQLDIKELSGSLNLGNNFGAKPNEKNGAVDEAFKRTQVSKESTKGGSSTGDSDSASQADAASKPERTSTGYKYTPPQSKA